MIVTRHHDFCAGHRIAGHPGKCANIHGHNYRVHFSIEGAINGIGIVFDFSMMKATLCTWVDTMWDHKLLIWEQDGLNLSALFDVGLVLVPFNPTAENMAQYLLDVVGPLVLPDTVKLSSVIIEETRKCSVTASNRLLSDRTET